MSLFHWLAKLTHQTLYREKTIGKVSWRQWCHGDWTLKILSEIVFCFILTTGFVQIVIRFDLRKRFWYRLLLFLFSLPSLLLPFLWLCCFWCCCLQDCVGVLLVISIEVILIVAAIVVIFIALLLLLHHSFVLFNTYYVSSCFQYYHGYFCVIVFYIVLLLLLFRCPC